MANKENSPHSLPLLIMDNIKTVLHCDPGFQDLLLWKSKRYSYQFFYFLFCITVYNFLELHLTLSEKCFCQKCLLFNEFAQIHHPRNGQNVLGVTRVFYQFSLNCLLKYFSSKICWQNPAEASFMYQQWTPVVYTFL